MYFFKNYYSTQNYTCLCLSSKELLIFFSSILIIINYLRGRLTLRGLSFRRKPQAFGDSISHTIYRYSCQHSQFRYLYTILTNILHKFTERSATVLSHPQLRYIFKVPIHFKRLLTPLVSYYAFFKRWPLPTPLPNGFRKINTPFSLQNI